MFNQIEYHKNKLKENTKELNQIKEAKFKYRRSYIKRKLQLKVMIKRHNAAIELLNKGGLNVN